MQQMVLNCEITVGSVIGSMTRGGVAVGDDGGRSICEAEVWRLRLRSNLPSARKNPHRRWWWHWSRASRSGGKNTNTWGFETSVLAKARLRFLSPTRYVPASVPGKYPSLLRRVPSGRNGCAWGPASPRNYYDLYRTSKFRASSPPSHVCRTTEGFNMNISKYNPICALKQYANRIPIHICTLSCPQAEQQVLVQK